MLVYNPGDSVCLFVCLFVFRGGVFVFFGMRSSLSPLQKVQSAYFKPHRRDCSCLFIHIYSNIQRVFIRAILNVLFKHKAVFSPICNWMIILWCLQLRWTYFLNHPVSQCNGDPYKMLIRILHSFLIINISIMDRCYNWHPTVSCGVKNSSCFLISSIFFFFFFFFFLNLIHTDLRDILKVRWGDYFEVILLWCFIFNNPVLLWNSKCAGLVKVCNLYI